MCAPFTFSKSKNKYRSQCHENVVFILQTVLATVLVQLPSKKKMGFGVVGGGRLKMTSRPFFTYFLQIILRILNSPGASDAAISAKIGWQEHSTIELILPKFELAFSFQQKVRDGVRGCFSFARYCRKTFENCSIFMRHRILIDPFQTRCL